MTDDAPLPPEAKLEDRVVDYVRRKSVPTDPAVMAADLGVPLNSLKRLLGNLARQKVLRRAGGGKFTTNRRYQ